MSYVGKLRTCTPLRSKELSFAMADPGSIAELFPEPLRPDPSVALDASQVRLPKVPRGPVHGAQFIIEIAGPKSVPAQQARELLGPQWHGALGEPEVYAMAPADSAWRLLSTTDGAGSYDSLALAWNLFSSRGQLSSASAAHLLKTAEKFAHAAGRRAFPFPAPAEVDALASRLSQARESFDVGLELIVQGPLPFHERDVWVASAALGLDLSTEGAFIWKVAGWDDAILAVASIEEGHFFSLRGVKSAAVHDALSIGFNVPRSPDPKTALSAAFRVAHVLADRLHAQALDEEGRALSPALEQELMRNLGLAIENMRASGLEPGSPLCLKLFA
jgi:hypothetical protein